MIAGLLSIITPLPGGGAMMHGADQVGTGEDVGFRP